MVIVVTIAGTTGQAGFGGTAAGPVFDTTMATALRRAGVPRDVPEEIDEMIAKQQLAASKKRGKAPVEVDSAELATPLTEEELREAEGGNESDNSVLVVDADPNAPKVPNFVGKTVRDVMQEATSTGIDVDLFGDGLAQTQRPAAGAVLVPGTHIHVQFAPLRERTP